MIEISKQFYFDAAHFIPHMADGHAYRQMHGHSFKVQIAVQGKSQPDTGWVMDFDALDKLVAEVRSELDHRVLNEIEGLTVPTLENLCAWLWRRLAGQLPGLARVTIARESVGQRCTLSGPPD